MAWVLCTSGQAIQKAGANMISSSVWQSTNSGPALLNWSNDAEDYLCGLSRYDLVTNYGSLTSNGKKLLGGMASDLIAGMIINYDMSGYTSQTEAQTMLNILDDRINKSKQILENQKNNTYLGINP